MGLSIDKESTTMRFIRNINYLIDSPKNQNLGHYARKHVRKFAYNMYIKKIEKGMLPERSKEDTVIAVLKRIDDLLILRVAVPVFSVLFVALVVFIRIALIQK